MANALTQRQAGRLKDYCLSFNGSMFPSQPISTSNSANPAVNKILGAVAYCNLLRCLNQNSSVDAGGILSDALYNNALDNYASDGANSKRFIGAVDLDRLDNNNDKYLQGYNCLNQQVNIVANWESPGLTEAQMLYCFMQYDVSFELRDGLLWVNK